MIQKEAMKAVENETRKFVKMVRVQRDCSDEQLPLGFKVSKGSQPYLLSESIEEDEGKSKKDLYVPIYELN